MRAAEAASRGHPEGIYVMIQVPRQPMLLNVRTGSVEAECMAPVPSSALGGVVGNVAIDDTHVYFTTNRLNQWPGHLLRARRRGR